MDYILKTNYLQATAGLNNITLDANYLWDMSKYFNIYQNVEPNIGLSFNEKKDLLREIDYWIKISQYKFR